MLFQNSSRIFVKDAFHCCHKKLWWEEWGGGGEKSNLVNLFLIGFTSLPSFSGVFANNLMLVASITVVYKYGSTCWYDDSQVK